MTIPKTSHKDRRRLPNASHKHRMIIQKTSHTHPIIIPDNPIIISSSLYIILLLHHCVLKIIMLCICLFRIASFICSSIVVLESVRGVCLFYYFCLLVSPSRQFCKCNRGADQRERERERRPSCGNFGFAPN